MDESTELKKAKTLAALIEASGSGDPLLLALAQEVNRIEGLVYYLIELQQQTINLLARVPGVATMDNERDILSTTRKEQILEVQARLATDLLDLIRKAKSQMDDRTAQNP
jgi:hypothetical protein